MDISQETLTPRSCAAADLYTVAKQAVVALGFGQELCWQQSLDLAAFSESDLLREAAWVVLCSGFREVVVRRVFPYVSLCFCEWESAELIVEYREHCRAAVLPRFSNSRKIDAIIQTADLLNQVGFDHFKRCVLASPIETLRSLPYIGPITAFHLAKNLGLPFAKPDRHLQRLAARIGYESVQDLCHDVADVTGDSVQVVDLVLWRYCERLGAHPSMG